VGVDHLEFHDNRELTRLLAFSLCLQHPSYHHNMMSSTTKAVDTVDHVILGGMHDNKATKCWLRLLRHGVVFRIDACANDLESTPLHRQWQDILEATGTSGTTFDDRDNRWGQLCDLLIKTSLPVLQQLAPKVPQDRSLRGCYHTPTYYLQLVRDSGSQEVRASVTSGPVDESPYGFQAAKEDGLGAFGLGLKQHRSCDVKIVETTASLSMGPRKVETPDGTVHCLQACAQDSKRLGTDHISNNSRDAIRTYLHLHRDPLKVPGVPAVSGLVVDEDAFAGILLQDIQSAECLAARFGAVTTLEGLETIRRLVSGWQARISSVVVALHDRGYYIHDEVPELGIDQSVLFVDEKDEIWLPLSQISQQSEMTDHSSELMKKDEEAVRRVFGEYVSEELARLEAQTGST